jgi:hypothetical protein
MQTQRKAVALNWFREVNGLSEIAWSKIPMFKSSVHFLQTVFMSINTRSFYRYQWN